MGLVHAHAMLEEPAPAGELAEPAGEVAERPELAPPPPDATTAGGGPAATIAGDTTFAERREAADQAAADQAAAAQAATAAREAASEERATQLADHQLAEVEARTVYAPIAEPGGPPLVRAQWAQPSTGELEHTVRVKHLRRHR